MEARPLPSKFDGEIDMFQKIPYLLRASDDIVVRYWLDSIRLINPEYEDRPELDSSGRLNWG